MSTSGLSPACQHLFTAKSASGLTFGQLGSKIGRDEVWVAALFFGSAKADHDELLKLAKVLNLEVAAVSSLLHEYPSRGQLWESPPRDPLIYRLYEMLVVYSLPIKAIINEKMGDGIMSAIDFRASVEKVEDPKGDRVKITFDGKFLPYAKW